MDWDEDPQGHGDEQDRLNKQHSSHFHPAPLSAFGASTWDGFGADSAEESYSKRLDYLLPIDGDTGVATHDAVYTYLDSMIELMSRHTQPLSVLSIAVDDTPVLRFLGREGATLIGRAVARCLRQETRTHDVVGHAALEISPDEFTFLVTCPLLSEDQAANLGERLRAAMTAHSADGGQPWLTLCVGVACISIDTNESASLIARSMDALRRARKSGGNRVWRHSDTRRTLIANSEGQLADELDSKFREGFGRGGDDGRDAPGKG